MFRASLKVATLTGLSLLGGTLGPGCSKNDDPTSGRLSLKVVRPKGPPVTSVTETVVDSSNRVILGPETFAVPASDVTIAFEVVLPVTPAGDAGDEVQLSATTGGGTCTGTSGRFQVAPGSNTTVTMTVTCNSTSPGATGNVGVTATPTPADHCPNITSAVVGPDQTSFDGTASLTATASDPDPGETLTFTWQPASNITNAASTATSSSAMFSCAFPGVQPITLTVADNHTPPCHATAMLTIKCDSPPCGDGIIEPGETCDPPSAGTCSATCQTVQNPLCTICEETGTTEDFCGATSAPGQGTPGAFGCDSLASATDRANCFALLFCLRSPACRDAIHAATPDYFEAGTYPQPYDDPHPCLCGDIPLAACVVASTWTGVCASQFVAAAAADHQTVPVAYTSSSSPVGLAVDLSICDIDASCESVCGVPL